MKWTLFCFCSRSSSRDAWRRHFILTADDAMSNAYTIWCVYVCDVKTRTRRRKKNTKSIAGLWLERALGNINQSVIVINIKLEFGILISHNEIFLSWESEREREWACLRLWARARVSYYCGVWLLHVALLRFTDAAAAAAGGKSTNQARINQIRKQGTRLVFLVWITRQCYAFLNGNHTHRQASEREREPTVRWNWIAVRWGDIHLLPFMSYRCVLCCCN